MNPTMGRIGTVSGQVMSPPNSPATTQLSDGAFVVRCNFPDGTHTSVIIKVGSTPNFPLSTFAHVCDYQGVATLFFHSNLPCCPPHSHAARFYRLHAHSRAHEIMHTTSRSHARAITHSSLTHVERGYGTKSSRFTSEATRAVARRVHRAAPHRSERRATQHCAGSQVRAAP